MNRFIRGLRISKELVAILGIAFVDFFLNLGLFLLEGIMIILSLIVWLAILALFLMMSG
ncbi:MAG: hypothetical protein KGD64_13480 [Candidatus Heimdallarchaeota archaeon]|nr:hypothetical protein [Candidatus Heimdallarchaeota archaeon]